uniref:Uncharacterized LOC103140605 n=1 Tax=Poecilia formosa TaxID=48698 RepID=A0A096M7Q4_POEFO
MFQCLEFVAFICLFLAAKTTTEQILPPQNLSLHWIDEFNAELTWEPPPHSVVNCSYRGKVEQDHETRQGEFTSYTMKNHYTERGLKSYSLQTVCHDKRSQPAVLNTFYPEDLVKSFDFYIISAKQGHCSWSPVITTPELRFFYHLPNKSNHSAEIQECSSYTYTDGVKSGCNLDATTRMAIRMLFNATVNNTVVRNTFFWDDLKGKVKPPAPEWTVKKNKNNFTISWTPPDVLRLESWTFQINYNECEKTNQRPVAGTTSSKLERSSNCRYCIWIQATSEFGNSLPTDEKCFGTVVFLHPDRGSYLVYVVIAALVVTLAAISIACLLRNGKRIFPKIPVPSNFFKDVIENDNEVKSFFRKLYVPPEEQENCTITVVRDTQTIKPDF